MTPLTHAHRAQRYARLAGRWLHYLSTLDKDDESRAEAAFNRARLRIKAYAHARLAKEP